MRTSRGEESRHVRRCAKQCWMSVELQSVLLVLCKCPSNSSLLVYNDILLKVLPQETLQLKSILQAISSFMHPVKGFSLNQFLHLPVHVYIHPQKPKVGLVV